MGGLEIPAGETAALIGDALAAFLANAGTVRIDFAFVSGDGAFFAAINTDTFASWSWILDVSSNNFPNVLLSMSYDNAGEGANVQLGDEDFTGRRIAAFLFGADILSASYNGGAEADDPDLVEITGSIEPDAVVMGNPPGAMSNYAITIYSIAIYDPQPSADLPEMAGEPG